MSRIFAIPSLIAAVTLSGCATIYSSPTVSEATPDSVTYRIKGH